YTDLAATATLDEPSRIKLKKGAAVRYLEMHHEIFEKINHDPEPTDSIRVENFRELREGIRKYRRVALIGDPGAGKTTTLERLAYELAAEAAEHEAAPLPLLARLGGYDGSDFEAFLEGSFGQLSLKSYLPGRVFLLLDGLNETPPEHVKKIQDWIQRHDQIPVIVSCRKLDYTGLKLPLQRIDVAPLDMDRIYLFLGNYLEDDDQENLFWSLAGEKLHTLWKTWKQDESTFDEFLQVAQNIQHDHLPGLLGVVTNPFLLFVTIQIYTRWGKPPKNRGQLFENFVTLLMAQRGRPAAVSRPPWIEEHIQIKALSALAHRMQMERKGTSVSVEWAKLVIQDVHPDAEQILYLAASASIIEYGSRIRFVHQLLQEYFAAHRMLEDMKQGVPASKYWPLMIQWWLPTGWEETAVLMAGLQGDASEIIQWITPVQPILAYRCLKEGGADYSDAAFRMLLHPPAGGRANPIVHIEWLQQKIAEEGDKRTGVGLRLDGLPDIEWIEIPTGYFTFGGRKTRVRTVYDSELPERKLRLPTFHIARYPVTWLQYQAFVESLDGYANEEWWKYSDHARQWRKDNPTSRQTRFNHPGYPRVQITWYEAVAFCQWLSARLHEKITLPTEQQWEKA
ncbi:MAG: SUMF1/EgtB/PvdO family nonheme iron enzyme, partial [Anaerolineae bacterium]|nr:SUMF1/EgtB/PvdO family nonheme iron enzyme [Anaerolineae bacterium]